MPKPVAIDITDQADTGAPSSDNSGKSKANAAYDAAQITVLEITHQIGRELGESQLSPGPFERSFSFFLESTFDHQLHACRVAARRVALARPVARVTPRPPIQSPAGRS